MRAVQKVGGLHGFLNTNVLKQHVKTAAVLTNILTI